MRNLIPLATVIATLSLAATAVAGPPLARVDDPTPTGSFTGKYDCSFYTYDAEGNATKHERTCEQKGYVAVYDDGVVACNGNEQVARPDNGEPLQGYIWVGAGHAAKDPTAASPGNHAGAGNNTTADDPSTQNTDESHGPCEDKPGPR